MYSHTRFENVFVNWTTFNFSLNKIDEGVTEYTSGKTVGTVERKFKIFEQKNSFFFVRFVQNAFFPSATFFP